MADIENGRCHAERAPLPSPPLFQQGTLVLQTHDIGWLITGCFTLVSAVVSFWLIDRHLQWYTNKAEQRYIVRILLMVPIYAVVSFASYLFWNHSTPLLLLRDCYESTVLTSFFYLLLLYLSHDPEEQKEIFRKLGLSRDHDRELRRRGQPPKKWMFPLGSIKWKPIDGLYFFQLMKWGVLQYCVIRPTTTLIAIILDDVGLYCEDSWSPGWGYLYITVIVSVSVTIAMYCLLQLYMSVSTLLKPQKPLLKLFAVKAVVFLTFWQASGLSLLTTFGVVKDTPYMTADNIITGIAAIAETFEMMIFAILHIFAFSYKPYYAPPNSTKRLPSLVHAFNFRETLDEVWAGARYMWHKYRGRETDVQARRQAALENVFGQSRLQIHKTSIKHDRPARDSDVEKGLAVEVEVEETVHVGQERQWLGVGDNYAYSLAYQSRHQEEKSEGLGDQIERELAKRGHPLPDPDQDAVQEPLHRKRSSWWRNAFARLSQSEHPPEPSTSTGLTDVDRGRPRQRPREFRRMAGRKLSQVDTLDETYDDPPPSSAIRTYRESKSRKSRSSPAPDKTSASPETSPLLHTVFSGPVSPISLPRPAEISAAPPSPPPLSLASSDSLLARVFSPGTETSHSNNTEILTAGATSSQSHRSRLQLSAEPVLVPRTILTQSPVILPAPAPRRHTLGMTHDVPRTADPGPSIDLSDSPPRPSRSHHRDSAFYSKSTSRSSRSRPHHLSGRGDMVADPHQSTSVPKPSRLRRDQIVLPAPLAPSATRRTPRHSEYPQDRLSLSPPTRMPQSLGDHAAKRASRRATLPAELDPSRDLPAAAPYSPTEGASAHPLRRHGATRGKGRRYTDTSLQPPLRQDSISPTRKPATPIDFTPGSNTRLPPVNSFSNIPQRT
ncbi:hypothetical protein NM688_g6987 [Phlebia brevispora]|uniref:Uncharacterized protein n=1 Tax=Phlebia brevispora TaxID=194682 RepID=A0ACC1SAG0_9APHY|nr:hypothetical protein NM688_g6987 [Phlebia brevispora]